MARFIKWPKRTSLAGGKELFYRSNDQIIAASIEVNGSELSVVSNHTLPRAYRSQRTKLRCYGEWTTVPVRYRCG